MLTRRRRPLTIAALTTIIACFTTSAHAQTKPGAQPPPPAKPAGGPAAAAPVGAEPAAEATKKEGEDEDKETNRAIYFSGDLAFTRVDLGALSNNLGFEKTAANGVLYGLAVGLRQKDMRYGIRWRVYDTTEFALWSFAASIGYGLPIRPLSPIFSFHLGYVWDQKIQQGALEGSIPRGTVLPPDVDVRGLLVGVDVNASYWITRFLRLGVYIGGDFYLLHRLQANLPVAVPPITPQERQHPLYTEDGSGVGFSVNAGLRGAFDIGF